MSSAIARYAVTPSQRFQVMFRARTTPPTPVRLAPPLCGPNDGKPAGLGDSDPSRRNVLIGLAGAGAGAAFSALRKPAELPAAPWLACAVEPYSEEPLHDSPLGRALYPHGQPRLEDVLQGSVGDCYLLSALMAVLHRGPWHITQRIRVTGVDADGTGHFQVGLYSHPVQGETPRIEWICVSAKFPPPGAKGALWVSLFEKAFAKYNDAYKVLRDRAKQGYSAIDVGGLGEGLEAITGKKSRTVFFANDSAPEDFPWLPPMVKGHVSRLFKRPRTAGFLIFDNLTNLALTLPDGSMLRRCTFADGARFTSFGNMHHMVTAKGENFAVYGHHAYAVLDVNAQGDILLRNPHGHNPLRKGAEFWLPRRCVDRMAVGYVAVVL